MESLPQYPSGFTDAEWQWVQVQSRGPRRRSRPFKHSRGAIFNAIFYRVRAGCAWRVLPKTFPPWRIVCGYFHRWGHLSVWLQWQHLFGELLRCQYSSTPAPTAAILASVRGVDAGNKPRGRKRHLLVHTVGLVILDLVTPASVQDQDGAKSICWTRC